MGNSELTNRAEERDSYHMWCFETAALPSIVLFRQKLFFSQEAGSADFGRGWRVWGILTVVHAV
jgi:hypothetical protein